MRNNMTMTAPKISVIVPFYNVEKYLRECLDSLVAQTFSDFEVIMINDGSTDGSERIAQEYVERNTNFKLLSQKNKGQSAARNLGLDYAEGKYIYFLDSDDYIEKTLLEKTYAKAEECQLEVLNFCSYTFGDGYPQKVMEPYQGKYEGIYTGSRLFREMIQYGDSRLIHCGWMLIRRNLIEENHLRFVEGIIHEDYLFQWGLMAVCRKVMVMNEPLYYYRVRPGSTITDKRNYWRKWKGLVVCAKKADEYLDAHTELKLDNMQWYVKDMMTNAINNGYMNCQWDYRQLPENAKLHFEERKLIWKNGWYKEKHMLYYGIWPWGYKKFIQITQNIRGYNK
jgi:glycosyltransferase involved in cell wall biosynthesis